MDILSYNEHKNEILQNIQIEYQPIWNLNTGSVIAHESLSRGYLNNNKISPLEMIDLFSSVGKLDEFDVQCHKNALNNYTAFSHSKQLFLNIETCSMIKYEHRLNILIQILERNHISPRDIVFEITERIYKTDQQQLERIILKYKEAGFEFAIDDVDEGNPFCNNAFFESFSYVKISRKIIANIDKDNRKKTWLKAFTNYAKLLGLKIVAEGVETEQELQWLIENDIDYAQGFYLAKPSLEPLCLDDTIQNIILNINKKKLQIHSNHNYTDFIGRFAKEIPAFNCNMKCKDVLDVFEKEQYNTLCFVNNLGSICGYCCKMDILMNFAKMYGYSLYAQKPISTIFADTPLVLDYNSSINLTLDKAMQRNEHSLYHDIIVCDKGEYYGIVSMQDVISLQNEMSKKKAKQLNPLSGLPGNNIINYNISKYLYSKRKVLVAYVDLSDFKVYNDFYGFENGDIVIKKTAEILKNVFFPLTFESFVGHIGGDDYVCISEFEDSKASNAKSITKVLDTIISNFEEQKRNFYNNKDFLAGFISAANRAGKYEKTGLININIACHYGYIDHYDSVESFAKYMTSLKRESKKVKYSNYIVKFTSNNSKDEVACLYSYNKSNMGKVYNI